MNHVSAAILHCTTISRGESATAAASTQIKALQTSIKKYQTDAVIAQTRIRRDSSAIKIAKSLALCQTVDAIFHAIMEEVTVALSASRATFFLADKDRNQFWSKCRTDTSSGDILRVPLGEGIVGKCYSIGEIINVERASDDSSFYPRIDAITGFETTSTLCCPVYDISCTERLGVVQVLNKTDGLRFAPEDAEALSSFCFHIGLALDKFQKKRAAGAKVATAERRASEVSSELETISKEIKSLRESHGIQRIINGALHSLSGASQLSDVSAAVRTFVVQFFGASARLYGRSDGPDGGSFVSAAMQSGEVVRFELVHGESGGIAHCMCVPCVACDEIVAIIKITGNIGEEAFDCAKVGSLQSLCGEVAVAMKRIESIEKLESQLKVASLGREELLNEFKESEDKSASCINEMRSEIEKLKAQVESAEKALAISCAKEASVQASLEECQRQLQGTEAIRLENGESAKIIRRLRDKLLHLESKRRQRQVVCDKKDEERALRDEIGKLSVERDRVLEYAEKIGAKLKAAKEKIEFEVQAKELWRMEKQALEERLSDTRQQLNVARQELSDMNKRYSEAQNVTISQKHALVGVEARRKAAEVELERDERAM